jgi:iron complex outermembrane receptor protein
MLQKKSIGGSLSLRVAIASALGLGIVTATPAQDAPDRREVETVIVTGSFIRGTPEDAAVPVDVLSAEDLETQGSPTVVQLVKTITASQSALGESNRYNGGGGTASINLRGFGASRTLALMNGRRLAESPVAAFQGGGANLNFIPQAAIGRIELLKDGAAATYGSDAIGGVVNFITRTDLDGLELDAEYSYIEDSDGDYSTSVAWGKRFERGNLLFAATYRHRSRLDVRDRDWALARYDDANYGGWTGAGNPGFYVNPTTGATLFRDNGCTELGGQLTDATTAPTTSTALTSTCRFQFSTFNDIVNKEDHYQAYTELNYDISDSVTMHAEVAYAYDDVPMQRLSPANLTAQYPSPISRGGTSGSPGAPFGLNQSVRYNVPAYHPGLIDLRTTCAAPLTGCDALMGGAAGVDISPLGWRAIAHAGHPTNTDKADHQKIWHKGLRASFGLNGDIGDVHWDTAVTAMRADYEVNTNDLVVSNLQLALNGFGSLKGGAPCTAARTPANAGRADLGCYFFNPFTNSVYVSAVNDTINPYYRGFQNPAVNNNPQLVEWLYGNYTNGATNDIVVLDAVFSGELPMKLWGDDNIGWAVGAQGRYNKFEATYGDLFNTTVTPCVDSVDDGTPGCANAAGPLIFFGSDLPFEDDREVYAVFAETRVPVTNSFDVSLAVRYEAYGGSVGSTTDPKLSLRWQPLDWLAFRGSASTTFRAPVLPTLDPGCATGVVQISGQYRAQETCGNAGLKPETADTFNVGILLSPGNFTASVDYFLFKFEGELTLESSSRMAATLSAPGACDPTNAQYAPLRARFTFANDVCGAANTLRVSRYNLNGPETETSGFDVRLQYDFPELFGGSAAIGVEGTYLEKYERGEFTLKDNPGIVIAPAEDRAGKHDLISEFFSYPRLRGNAFLSYSTGPVTVRWQTRYTEGTEAAFGTSINEWVPNGAGGYTQQRIGKLDDYIQHDLVVRAQMPWDTTVVASVQNVLNEDPVDAPSQFNYDYTNGNPLGRVFEVALKKRF